MFLDKIYSLPYKHRAKEIETVVILFGPYRNLTTLLASVLSLHPVCQVLNHAGERVLNDKKKNFLVKYNEKKFLNFLKFALYASQSGRRGQYGGGIFFSHAFDYEIMKEKYYSRYNNHLKQEIKCIFWKESLKISNFIRDNNVNLEKILKENEKIKFILPVRNPIDCAFSNLKTGHIKHFPDRILNFQDCLQSIFKEFVFFLKLKEKNPKRFFYFFEDDFISRLSEIACFLDLAPDKRWLKDSSEVININVHYNYSKKEKEKYFELLEKYFKDYPEFKIRLMKIIEVES